MVIPGWVDFIILILGLGLLVYVAMRDTRHVDLERG